MRRGFLSLKIPIVEIEQVKEEMRGLVWHLAREEEMKPALMGAFEEFPLKHLDLRMGSALK